MSGSSKVLMFAVLALLLAGAADARTTSTVIGTGGVYPNSGEKLLYAQASASHPASLSTKVITSPGQKVILKWAVSCGLGTAVGENEDPTTKQNSNQKTVTSPATVPLALPLAHPKTCSISVYAYLTKKANATAKLLVLQG